MVLNSRDDVEVQLFGPFHELVAQHGEAVVIAVDIPIGLVERGARHADVEARRFLSGQASSVFNAPARSVVAATDYGQANRLSRLVGGKGMSKQSFNLLAKIRDVAAFEHDERVFEVHPEVSFRLMNGGERVQSKKSWAGLQTRIRLLAAQGIELPADFEGADRVGIDDVVDAAAATWSARRIHAGASRSFPDQPIERSAAGRVIAIHA